MFISVTKKSIIFFLIVVLLLSFLFFLPSLTSVSPKRDFNIVIDAGHGGRDGGSVGVSGTKESELNLMYAKKLQNIFQQFEFGVVMTRHNMKGLYDEHASNKKKSEMKKRREIINNSGCDILISIHMNSSPLGYPNGAQTFYAKSSSKSAYLAKCVQSSFIKTFENAKKNCSTGDYFVLNCSKIPAILIECGYLSNVEEEQNLQDKKYCEKFCYSVAYGVIQFFN